MGNDLYSQRQTLKDNLEQKHYSFFKKRHFEITSTYSGSTVLINLKHFMQNSSDMVEKIKNLLKTKKNEGDKIEVDLDDPSMSCDIEIIDDKELILVISGYVHLKDIFLQDNQIENLINGMLYIEKKISN